MSSTTHFPPSRELFRLVRNIADDMDQDQRLSDVEIGRLVGFESARTSRWKHGQISVADAARLHALSQSFDIDITVLVQVAAGYLNAREALRLMAEPGKLVRFLSEQLVLPTDDQMLSITDGEGTRAKVVRRSAGHYQRSAKRIRDTGTSDQGVEPHVLLVDDDESTIGIFQNLTGADTGMIGSVARNGPEALIIAGKHHPQLIIFDIFIGQVDGFTALRNLAQNNATSEAELFATSLSVSPDIVRAARGSGALDVLQRPLKARTLSRLLTRLRRRS
jgi:CheY-like chemotaxis protein